MKTVNDDCTSEEKDIGVNNSRNTLKMGPKEKKYNYVMLFTLRQKKH